MKLNHTIFLPISWFNHFIIHCQYYETWKTHLWDQNFNFNWCIIAYLKTGHSLSPSLHSKLSYLSSFLHVNNSIFLNGSLPFLSFCLFDMLNIQYKITFIFISFLFDIPLIFRYSDSHQPGDHTPPKLLGLPSLVSAAV